MRARPCRGLPRRSSRPGGSGSASAPFRSLANVENAEVIDSSVTSPDPSASDGTLGTEPTPINCAYCTVTGMPTSSSIRTAARLLDVRSAVRIVIDGLSRCSSSGTHAPWSVMIGSIELVDERGRREAALERGGVDKRLERRARLALGLRGAIEGALLEVAAADHARARRRCAGPSPRAPPAAHPSPAVLRAP